jgi:predicted  nucleic acid-binding Zn-ribbon protein
MNRNHERQEAESDRRHLAHKKSQLTELKDQLLTREIGYKAYQPAAYGLAREIRELEGKLRDESETPSTAPSAGGETR